MAISKRPLYYTHRYWKQWWSMSLSGCCSKRIFLLLVWVILLNFSRYQLLTSAAFLNFVSPTFITTAEFISSLLAPFIGWLADVKFGRYETTKLGSLVSVTASIFFYFALFTGGASTLSIWLFIVSFVILGIGNSCFSAAMLPFLTDQLIGATADELSTLIHWYVWADNLGCGLSFTIYTLGIIPYLNVATVGVAGIFALPLALIIISDCLCQQWLDKTHKVANPIKLIIQVLNYTRKHEYPERRSAFTYLDEEHPSRMDFGKDKFGGPFTEEEVEDVKTLLRLLPLLVCLSLMAGTSAISPESLLVDLEYTDITLNIGIKGWLLPLIMIPIYRCLVYPLVYNRMPSMLTCIGTGFLLYLIGFIMLVFSGIWGVNVTSDWQRYISCRSIPPRAAMWPDYYVEWYWKLVPFLLFSTGKTIMYVFFLEFLVAQLPDRIKGLGIGLLLAFSGTMACILGILQRSFAFTLCYDVPILTGLVLLFMVFLVLSNHYTLRERNREINIQAIVEDHHERYINQEEEFLRENPQYRDIDSSNSSSYDTYTTKQSN